MPTPSIKGTALDSVLQDVRRLVDEGRISRAELETSLEPEDLGYVDEKIAASRWYPIGGYTRLLELLCQKESDGNSQGYLFQRGAIAAERLHAAGIYPQLDASAETLGLRVLPLVISVAGAIYNFTRWRFEIDEGGDEGFRILVEEAEAYPEVARYVAEGFLHCTTQRVIGRAVRVRSERATPDRVVFHATFPGDPAS